MLSPSHGLFLVAARFYNETGRFGEALSSGNEAIECCDAVWVCREDGHLFCCRPGAAYRRLAGETERGLAGQPSRAGALAQNEQGRFLHVLFFERVCWTVYCVRNSSFYDDCAGWALRGKQRQVVAETDERSYASELLRPFRGRLLALMRKRLSAKRTASLWQAVEWARSRSLKLFELRALRDPASIDISPSGEKISMKELRGLVAWFPKALKMPDLQEARLIIGQHLSN